MEDLMGVFTSMAVYAVPILFFVSVMTFIIAYTTPKVKQSEIDRLEIIKSLSISEIDEVNKLEVDVRKDKINNLSGWYRYWYNSFNRAGVGKIQDIKQPGTVAIMFALIGAGLGFVVLKFIGLIIGPILAIVVLSSIKSAQAVKKNAQFDSQLGLLVDAMKQNLQGSKSTTNALVDAIDELPDPLYSELINVKYDIEVGTPIDEVLQDLGERNDSREMKFLAAALRITIINGGDLITQLNIISEKLNARARITRKIKEAVAQSKPTVMVVALATPLAALYSYTREGNAEAFASPTGMAMVVGGFLMYALGLILITKMVQKAKDF